MRSQSLLTLLSLSTVAAFGGMEYFTADQTNQPGPNFNVGFQTQKCVPHSAPLAAATIGLALLPPALDSGRIRKLRGHAQLRGP